MTIEWGWMIVRIVPDQYVENMAARLKAINKNSLAVSSLKV